MDIYWGQNALSTFRSEQLKTKLNQQGIYFSTLKAHSCYLLKLSGPLDDGRKSTLLSILDAKESISQSCEPTLFVSPRQGTRSPWSSKVADILYHCGFTQVQQVECVTAYFISPSLSTEHYAALCAEVHDPMMQTCWRSLWEMENFFQHDEKPIKAETVPMMEQGITALQTANAALGLALSESEITYLYQAFSQLQRNPSDVELYMFAQLNSEHCRHKVFNATWSLDGQAQASTLFNMIKQTYKDTPDFILSAYKDNAAVMTGGQITRLIPDAHTGIYRDQSALCHTLMKVETHNHPTGVCPHPGAATGSGGEIRDEGATGIGSQPKAGLVGYCVSHLRIPEFPLPWEHSAEHPKHLASPLTIMLEAPIGAAAYNNEFGRPALTGYFRTFEALEDRQRCWGYHKPIMLAGGLGTIDARHVEKKQVPVGAKVIVLGGAGMTIGLGGGSASSVGNQAQRQALDFASVQRADPQVQRRCQEVINHCWQLGDENPILFIHDVGAGGLSNALPELVNDAGRGGRFDLRAIPVDEAGMSPRAIWSNESQERYVLAIAPESLACFDVFCKREFAPYAVVGEVTEEQHLTLFDAAHQNTVVDVPLTLLFGQTPKMLRNAALQARQWPEIESHASRLEWALEHILYVPCIAEKSFLITIGDRSVTGLVARDQMIGPWQVPVADCGVTLRDYQGYAGEVMAIGERSPVALLSPKAATRLAITEAITNILAADIDTLKHVKLSANWMASVDSKGEDANLYHAVEAIAQGFAKTLDLTIPVGKDSMSMRASWQDNNQTHEVVSPVSLVVSAFAPVQDARKTWTPDLKTCAQDTHLLLIDLSCGRNRLGGSCYAQILQQLGNEPADLDVPLHLKRCVAALKDLRAQGSIMAYHDRSDGGVWVTLLEMAFAGQMGVDLHFNDTGAPLVAALFAEEPGFVIQVSASDLETVLAVFKTHDLGEQVTRIGMPNKTGLVRILTNEQVVLQKPLHFYQKAWSKLSWAMQRLRDNPACADEEFAQKTQFTKRPEPYVSFNVQELGAPVITGRTPPRVAILREQGVNSHVEMAAAFTQAGFEAVDIHMSDLQQGNLSLDTMQGLVVCGGFSYGDVLGAGSGWAVRILQNPKLRDMFQRFFEHETTFSLGVCNGCQVLSQLKQLIPGAGHWPRFTQNTSGQFEARLSFVKVQHSPSVLLQGMQDSYLPIPVAHGEGRVIFDNKTDKIYTATAQLIALTYADPLRRPTGAYPLNPNGSENGMTGFTTCDGRVTIMMPHPERGFRTATLSWAPESWPAYSPWFKMFKNAWTWLQ